MAKKTRMILVRMGLAIAVVCVIGVCALRHWRWVQAEGISANTYLYLAEQRFIYLCIVKEARHKASPA